MARVRKRLFVFHTWLCEKLPAKREVEALKFQDAAFPALLALAVAICWNSFKTFSPLQTFSWTCLTQKHSLKREKFSFYTNFHIEMKTEKVQLVSSGWSCRKRF